MVRHAGPAGASDRRGADAFRLTARVYGVVQGVGFRFRTMGQAEELGLAGEVKNLDDGSVSVVAEGPESRIHKLLDWLNSAQAPGRVDRVDHEVSAAEGNFRGFNAR